MKTLELMSQHGHERVCFWHDAETGMRAIIALHSTVLGNALGGTRRWHYGDEHDALHDVLRLSEGMTYKAACAGLPMGGAKSVVLLPEPGMKGSEAEARAMGRFVDTFNGQYIAAEDVGVDWMNTETEHVQGGTGSGQGGDPSPHTAMGVLRGMQACLRHINVDQFTGLTVAIQGVGSVGAHLARLLHEHGAELVVADINESLVMELVESCGARAADVDEILHLPCDILAPCALGGVLGGESIGNMQARIVCGAANNQLEDPSTDGNLLLDRGILYAPDFIVNAGGLIHLAGTYLEMSEAELEAKINEIEHTTSHILEISAERTIATNEAAAELALHRIQTGSVEERLHAG